MLTASELLKKKLQSAGEKKKLEERIKNASETDSPNIWDAQGIISPFDRSDYELSLETKQWLAKYGWKLEEGHIRTISEEEHYIP